MNGVQRLAGCGVERTMGLGAIGDIVDQESAVVAVQELHGDDSGCVESSDDRCCSRERKLIDRRRVRRWIGRLVVLLGGLDHRADELIAGGATGDSHGELGSQRFACFEQPQLSEAVGPYLFQTL